MAGLGRGDAGPGKPTRPIPMAGNYPGNQHTLRDIRQGMKQLQVSGGQMQSNFVQQNEQPVTNDTQTSTPWTVTNVPQDKRSTRHAKALMEIRHSLQSYELKDDVDRTLLDKCISYGFDEEVSRETLRANRGKEFGVVLATLMSLTELSGRKAVRNIAPGSLQYARGSPPVSVMNPSSRPSQVRSEQSIQNPPYYGNPMTSNWNAASQNTTGANTVFIKSAAVPPGRLQNTNQFLRRTGPDGLGKGVSSGNDPLRVDRTQFNISERKISDTSLNNYPEVRLRQNRPGSRDSQKRWSADVIQKAKAMEMASKRSSLAFEVGDRRSLFDVPNKPPPPYPGFGQPDLRPDQWSGVSNMGPSNATLKRIASMETVVKIGTDSSRINSPVTIAPDNRKPYMNNPDVNMTNMQAQVAVSAMQPQDVVSYSTMQVNKQLPFRDPPPYHAVPHRQLQRTYSPAERPNPPSTSRLYSSNTAVSQGYAAVSQGYAYVQPNNPHVNSQHMTSAENLANVFVPIRPEPTGDNVYSSGQDESRPSRGSPPPYPGLDAQLTNKEKRFSYASDVDSGTSSKRTSVIFADGSTTQSDSSGSTSPTLEAIESRCSPLPMTNSPYHTLVIHPADRTKRDEEETIKSDNEPVSSRLKGCSSQAFKFYMEQHVENVLNSIKLREKRKKQLEIEMTRVGLSEESQAEMRKMLVQKESNHIRMRRSKMSRSMFSKVKTLGMGAFGEVALVRKIDSNALYAMKILRKTDVLKRNQVAHVKAERDILAEADNEWVVKLYYSFQDRNNLYFVMEYVPGGDLMALLIKRGIFSEELGRFYTAELVLAVESVHKMGFIHRDIKPDNVLIDRNGHIKLTDFGLCTGFRWTHDSKYYQQDPNHARQPSMEPEGGWEQMLMDGPCDCGDVIKKFDLCKPLDRRAARRHMRCLAHSLVGTPNYIAPEVLLRIPYTHVCDWWSVGVILYEMLVGQPPFLARSPAETQMKVVHWQSTLRVPRHSKLSREAESLILSLCSGPENRIGRQGTDEIKKHPFFIGVDWAGCLKSEPPPYTPKIRHATDTSNFDPVPEKETETEPDDSYDEEKQRIMDKAPQHAFYEFTFRRFFDEGGHPQALSFEEETRPTVQQQQQQHNGVVTQNNKRTVTTSDKSVPVPSKVAPPPLNQGKLEDKAPVYV